MDHKKTKALVFTMLMQNTGVAFMDSGGDEGRQWQRNAKRDIKRDPEVMLDYKAPCKSDDIDITVSLYHYLPTVLELDDQCDQFNSKFAKMENWDSDVYGVSKEARKWLRNHKFNVGNSWNSYNGESNLSQILQGTELKRERVDEGDYILLQVHGGADARGGYTDAKLFKYQIFQEFIDTCPRVSASIRRDRNDEPDDIALDMRDSGYGFVDENGEAIDILEGDIIEASL